MNVFQALFLGFLQGLTEFLPVSSSGHLVIAQKWLGFKEPPVLFDILVHIGTLVSLCFFFKKKILAFYRQFANLKMVLIGSLPAAGIGLLLNSRLEYFFDSLILVGFCLLVTAGLLFIIPKKAGSEKLNQSKTWQIGLFQALALLPGISRSGSTISAGLRQKLDRRTAFEFSFFLGMPAMAGAVLMQASELFEQNGQFKYGLIGMVSSFITGYVSLKFLRQAVIKGRLVYFSVYCLILGLIILVGQFF